MSAVTLAKIANYLKSTLWGKVAAVGLPFFVSAGAIGGAGCLSGCGGGTTSPSPPVTVVPSGTATPAPAPTPTPAPSPTPTPAPTPTPTPTASGTPLVVSEGDSISVFWGGNHTGIYAASRPTIQFKGLAVGGSGIDSLKARQAAVLALKPSVVSVFIGANDLASAWQYPATGDWLNALFSYTDTLRRNGSKVVVATVLPQTSAAHNARRAEANAAIRAAVTSHRIDGVIDFAADPVMGAEAAAGDKSLYQDGLHPTDGCGMGCGGQGKLAVIYAKAMNDVLAK